MKEKKSALKTNSRRKPWYKNTRLLQLYALCIIPVFLVILFNYVPMFGLIIAFKDYRYDKGILGSNWVGLKNFEFFFKSDDFARITWNTFSLNFIFIFCGIIAAVAVAILLFEIQRRASVKLFQTVMITPHFLSWVVVSYMAYALLNPQYGLVNSFLGKMGIAAVDWYTKPKAWPFILTVASVWKHVGMDCVIYYASLMGLDTSLFEAADVDGATKWQKIKYITIPSLVPLLTILTILKIGNIFRADFGLFYQLTRDVGTLYSTTDVIDTYIFRTMRVLGRMSMSSAAGLLQSVVGFVLVVVTNHVSKKIDPETGGLF